MGMHYYTDIHIFIHTKKLCYMLMVMVMYGYVWLCMVMYGYVWLRMVINGYVWLCMVMYGYQWLRITGVYCTATSL